MQSHFVRVRGGVDHTFINPRTGKWVPNAFVAFQDGQYKMNTYNGDPSKTNVFCGFNKTADGGDKDNSTANDKTVKKNKDFEGNVLLNYQGYYASMTHTNTYYLSTGISETTDASNLQIASYTSLPAEDEAILTAIGASGDYDRMLNFVFNERTRELLGEWNRWDELARTKLLVKRAKAFNPEAAPNVQDRHMYRPIPQKFIDTLQNPDGSNLSAEQKKAWQNPGY